MSGKSIFLSVFLFALTQFPASVFGLQCYQCRGIVGQNSSCEVNLENVNQMQCTAGFYCVTHIGNSTIGNELVINRLCGQANLCETFVAQQHHFIDNKATVTCSVCNQTDLCNVSNSLSTHTHIIMFVFGAIMLSNFFWNKSM